MTLLEPLKRNQYSVFVFQSLTSNTKRQNRPMDTQASRGDFVSQKQECADFAIWYHAAFLIHDYRQKL